MHSGELAPLEEFLNTRQPINKTQNAVIRLDKKYLKSLKSSEKEDWNIISSSIDFMSVGEFLNNAKLSRKPSEHKNYLFKREGPHKIAVEDRITHSIY